MDDYNYYADHYKQLVGKTIITARPMTPDEIEDFYWQGYEEEAWVLILNDGSALIPMRDPEGNGPGHLDIAQTETRDA
jgi:hypothetical protein